MRGLTKWVAALACAVDLQAVALAQAPAFDCGKAQGQVEKLICADAGLSALDRKLEEVYKAAAAKATGEMLTSLRAEQRGWVGGRNDCWKTEGPDKPTYLTASWRANSVHECVDGQYKIRISELQAVWRLVTPKGPGPVSFVCQNNPANEIVASFSTPTRRRPASSVGIGPSLCGSCRLRAARSTRVRTSPFGTREARRR